VQKAISLPVSTTKLLDIFCNQPHSHFTRSQFAEWKVHHIYTAEKRSHSNNKINYFPITVNTQCPVHYQLLHSKLISRWSFKQHFDLVAIYPRSPAESDFGFGEVHYVNIHEVRQWATWCTDTGAVCEHMFTQCISIITRLLYRHVLSHFLSTLYIVISSAFCRTSY